ncbi:MAG: 2-hydroxyacyl-CoA dehydratase family protein, partial [Chloroflexi bacterium]|nr:2-hydroxyacyl-CoA dehydratase family protein [Chloroflexota bacterium]
MADKKTYKTDTYKTEPFKIWKKAKEMRSTQWNDVRKMSDKGGLVVLGSLGHDRFLKFFDGVEYGYLPGEPFGAEVARFPELSLAACEAMEKKGYPADMCGYVRHYMGCAFLDRTPWGKFPKPQFCIEGAHCDSHNKWFQAISEHFNVPYFVFDEPEMFHWYDMPHHAAVYRYNNYMEQIEWLEKRLGKKMNFENLREHMINRRLEGKYQKSIMLENFKHIPTTIDLKSLFTLLGPGYSKEAISYYKELYDEVKDRIARGIAALPNEKARMLHDNIPPWYALHIFRYMEKWGVVCLPAHYLDQNWWWDKNKMELVVPKTYEEEGKQPPKTVEEAVWELASEPQDGSMTDDGPRDIIMYKATHFKVDGVIFHLNKGCEGWSRGRLLAKIAVEREAKLPT